MVKLIDGRSYETVGYVKRNNNDKSVFILIECRSVAGESGSGFVDSRGGLWVLHAAPHPDDERQILEEGVRMTGKQIKGLTLVSGPIGGNYD